MKTIYRILSQGCIISTLITIFFSIVTKTANELTKPAMMLSQYFLILAFSFAIALTNLLLSLRDLPKIVKISVHYTVLLAAFFVIFILSKKIQKPTGAQLFIFFFLFTVLYAAVWGIVFGFKKLIPKLTKSKKAAAPTISQSDGYTSLYH